MALTSIAPRRGRPRKFIGPSRPVTLTLPEHVIKALEDIDHDLSRAVVRLTQPQLAKQPHPPAELVSFGSRAVIVVRPTKTLEQRTGVLLVPLSDGRALISFDDSMTAARLELRIQDVLDEHALPEEDARIFESIGSVLKDARRSSSVSLRRQSIMVLEFVGETTRRKRAKATERVERNGGVE
ncbi:MAG TPA: hypothetical protein VM032_10875 [Vicinamibacterales bacterium]|nr:hypothetical protein [Vicinamibacterales bacterium]